MLAIIIMPVLVIDAVDFRRLSRRSWTSTMRSLLKRKMMGSSKVDLCEIQKLVLG